jgi:RNA polymerase sigma factor (sigma-70 family)
MTRSEFEHIAAQLRQRVLKVGLDFFSNKEDAEDAAQETMIQLWRYCEHIDAERNIEALAVRVAKNCCVSMYRKSSQRDGSFVTALDDVTKEPSLCDNSPQAQLEAQDTQLMLTEAIALLKPRERELFEMRQIEGLSADEVAMKTGIPKPSITAMVSAARKKVFTELKRRMKQ